MKPTRCNITNDISVKLIFTYDKPPLNEIPLQFENKKYRREIWQFSPSGHFISIHSMDLSGIYEGDYINATYKNKELMIKTFDRIISMPEKKSDNIGRFKAVNSFHQDWPSKIKSPKLLDIGSGTGVFPFIVKKNGWECTGIDPDPRSVDHLVKNIGVQGMCGDFIKLKPNDRYNIITLNKVLEHVENPIEMLSSTKDWLREDGFVYVEVPDGETASKEGKHREEFFIDHLNIFSIVSMAILSAKAGFEVQKIYRLKEPSSKYTIRAFLSKKINLQ